MGPLINKNKHFFTFTPSQQIRYKIYLITHTHLYIYINVNTGKQIEVNTFNLFIFFNPCFICKVNDHLVKSLLLVIIHILNFRQNWIKPMHKEGGFFLVKEMFLPAYYLDIITVIKLSVGSLFYCINIIMNL